MYNYQKYQKEQRLESECQNNYQSFMKDKETRKCKYLLTIVKNKALSNNHKKRVDVFMGQAINSPLEINKYTPPNYDPRGFLAQTKLTKSFRMNFHTTQERINDLEKTNSFLDGVPFKNFSSHKFRQFSSHKGQKPLRFKPNSTTSRLIDFLTLSRTNQIDVLNQSKSKQILKNCKNHLFAQKSVKDLSKQLMPVLNRKAYWNSLKSVLVQQTSLSICDKQNDHETNERSIKSSQQLEEAKKIVKHVSITNQQANRKANAVEALTKCHAIKPKLEYCSPTILRA